MGIMTRLRTLSTYDLRLLREKLLVSEQESDAALIGVETILQEREEETKSSGQDNLQLI